MNYEIFNEETLQVSYRDINITDYINDIIDNDTTDFNILSNSDLDLLKEIRFKS